MPAGKGPSSSFGPADIKLPGWSAPQLERAVQSLLKHVNSQKDASNALLGDEDEMLYLQLSLKTMPLQSRKDKPVRLMLPTPLYTPEGAEICLFVKDHQGEGHKEVKKRLQRFQSKGGVTKVVGIYKLKTKYESHEAKRELCKLYDLFLADERVLPMLPKLIGKSFFKKKKQPIPIDLTVKDFPTQVVKACGATYLYRTGGTCINLRVARSSFSVPAIVSNICTALVQAVEHLPKKWSNVQGVFLKTAESVALPVFQTLPDASQRITVSAHPPAAATHKSQPQPAAKQPQAQAQPAAAHKAAAAAAAAAGKKTLAAAAAPAMGSGKQRVTGLALSRGKTNTAAGAKRPAGSAASVKALSAAKRKRS